MAGPGGGMTANSKTRSLRKYEAEPIVCATDGGAPRLDLYSPFGPLIARTGVPPELVNRLNRFADGVVQDGTSMEILVPQTVAFEGGEESLAEQTTRLISRYYRCVENTVVKRVRIDVFWIVSQQASSSSPVHFHSGDISGVMYLKTPAIEQDEEDKTYISGRQAGYINFIIGGKQALSKSLISFKPQVGDFYIFPGWLLHGAEPFRGAGERRSLAFNAFVEAD